MFTAITTLNLLQYVYREKEMSCKKPRLAVQTARSTQTSAFTVRHGDTANDAVGLLIVECQTCEP